MAGIYLLDLRICVDMILEKSLRLVVRKWLIFSCGATTGFLNRQDREKVKGDNNL